MFTFTASELDTLTQLSVTGIILFGSHAQNTANAQSDIDIAIMHGPQYDKIKIYDTLYEILEAKTTKPTDIDIVFLSDAPMELQNHVATYGVPLYLLSPEIFAAFREHTMLVYSDFAYHRHIFQQATFDRISP